MRTRVGYAGGRKQAPTYRSLGDHSEALQVDFDPDVVSFAQLLEVFWQEHDPCRRPWSTQYKAILFYGDEAQRRVAANSAARMRRELGEEVTTELVALDRFWLAEDYHQKHALRSHDRLHEQVRALFDSEAAFRDAPLTARLNAWCAGELSRAELDAALAALGYRVRPGGAGVEVVASPGGALPAASPPGGAAGR